MKNERTRHTLYIFRLGKPKPIRASGLLWKLGFLLADQTTQLLEPRSSLPDRLKGSLRELTHVIGKGALQPIKDKPALLP